PSLAGRPLRPATDRRLGGPSPRQPANRARAPPRAPPSRVALPAAMMRRAHAVLAALSGGYPPPRGQVAHAFLSRPPLGGPKAAPSDLHVLGTPPAFILSQDQTLHHEARARGEPRALLSSSRTSPPTEPTVRPRAPSRCALCPPL